MEDEEKEPQSQCAEGAAGSHHLLMQAPILAASRRPEVDEVTDKAKHRGSDEFGTAQLVDKYEVFTEEQEGGCCGSSFLSFLNDLEQEGILSCHHGDVPPRLKGVCGWTVLDDKMDEWKRRRQTWFMQGKEGKPYKANSLYQFLRRLGFFPTEVTKRASHGLDFDGSRSFKWDGSRRHKYIQSKKERQQLSAIPGAPSRARAGPGQASVGLDLLGANGMVVGAGWQTPMEPPGRPLPVLDVRRAMDAGGERDGASVVAGAGGVGHGAWLQATQTHYGAPAHMHLHHPHAQYPAFPAASSASGSTPRGSAGGGEHLMRLMSPGAAASSVHGHVGAEGALLS